MIIYIAGMAIIAIPLTLTAREIVKENKRKKIKLALAMAYDRLVREFKLSIEHAEVLGKKIIAIDRLNKKLVLVNQSENCRQELCVPLMQVASSRVVEIRDERENCIKKIFLELKYKRIDKVVRYCFYDEQYDSLGELKTLKRRATHWKNRVDVHRFPGNVNIGMEYVL